jgi:hypothetical protein
MKRSVSSPEFSSASTAPCRTSRAIFTVRPRTSPPRVEGNHLQGVAVLAGPMMPPMTTSGMNTAITEILMDTIGEADLARAGKGRREHITAWSIDTGGAPSMTAVSGLRATRRTSPYWPRTWAWAGRAIFWLRCMLNIAGRSVRRGRALAFIAPLPPCRPSWRRARRAAFQFQPWYPGPFDVLFRN